MKALEELKRHPRWVLWRTEERGGKPTKVPYQPSGRMAKSTDASTWSEFATVAALAGQYDGIGFVLGDGYAGLDLDGPKGPAGEKLGIFDPDTGEISEEAAGWIAEFDTYTEISPSGQGVKLFFHCPEAVRSQTDKQRGIEFYSTGRYFTFTGWHLPDTPDAIESREDEARTFLNREFAGMRSRSSRAKQDGARASRHETLLLLGLEWWNQHGGDVEAIFAALCRFREDRAYDPLEKTDDELRGIARWIATRERRFPMSEAEAAQEIALELGAQLLSVPEWRRGFLFDGHTFERDRTEEIHRLVRERLVAMKERIDTSSDHAKRQIALLVKLDTARGIDSLTRLVLRERAFSPEAVDADPMLLGVRNGVIDLETGKLRPGDVRDRITRRADVAFDSDARCPMWETFLARVLPDETVRWFVQSLAGYSLTGLTVEQVIALLYGRGANGKTTLAELILGILGDYGLATPASTLLDRRGNQATNDLAALAGARFVKASEAGQGKRWDAATVKQLTGGDQISARFLYGEYFSFQPSGKIWFLTNDLPQGEAEDDALWRRIRLVPFNVVIPDPEQDPKLGKRLLNERAGILNWMLEGLRIYREEGLPRVQTMADAAAAYRDDQDLLGTWFRERCLTDPQGFEPTPRLFEDWKRWCETAGIKKPGSKLSFAKRLGKAARRLTIEAEQQTTGLRERGFRGLRLRSAGGALG